MEIMEIAVKGENFSPPCTRTYHIFIDTFRIFSSSQDSYTFESSHLLAPLFSGIFPFVISMQARLEFI